MKIGQAIDRGGPDGSVPNSNFDYMVGVVGPPTGEPVINKRGEIIEPHDAFRIYWWGPTDDLEQRCMEREFEVSTEADGSRRVHWRAGDDDPSGPVTLFVQNDLINTLYPGA